MTYIITEPCVGVCDRACVEECPVDCIQPRNGYGSNEGAEIEGKQLYIDPETCIDCGACEPVCPVTAIFPEADVPEEMQKYIAINYEHFDQTPP